jgi:antitoxin MazE
LSEGFADNLYKSGGDSGSRHVAHIGGIPAGSTIENRSNLLYLLRIYRSLIMRSQVTKWGNSLAVRIPRAFAKQAGFEEGSTVDIIAEPDRIVLVKPVPSLKELVDRITPENRHEETDWGPPRGREIW